MNTPKISIEDMERRVARFGDMKGASLAFMDQRIPGHEREIVNLIGFETMAANIIENKDDPTTQPLIPDPAHGFTLQVVHAEDGGGSALHAHETEEVFMPMVGPWSIFWMEGEQEREIILDPFDVVSVPTEIYRGFRYVGEGRGSLLALIGGPDAGNITWHPKVIEKARETGIAIDDEGVLIEVAAEA